MEIGLEPLIEEITTGAYVLGCPVDKKKFLERLLALVVTSMVKFKPNESGMSSLVPTY